MVLYGHYDVQPPGPEELWTSPPFEPTVRDGALYARGASDDKGNLFMLLAAVQRLAGEGRLPVRAAFLVEGEEESGGSSALDHLAADAERAAATVIFDSVMIGPGRPTICTGVRGLVYRRVRVRTASTDAHSGLYGGAALNAAHALMAILGAVVPREGRLPAPLYAGVAPAGAVEVAAWDELPSGAEALATAGLRPADAERPTASTCARWPRPPSTSTGSRAVSPGAVKTNIPGDAHATLSLRLAPGQDVEAVAASLDGLLRAAAPAGAEIEIEDLSTALPRPSIRSSRPWSPRPTAWSGPPAGARRRCAWAGPCPSWPCWPRRGSPRSSRASACRTTRSTRPTSTCATSTSGIGTQAAMEILLALGQLEAPQAG